MGILILLFATVGCFTIGYTSAKWSALSLPALLVGGPAAWLFYHAATWDRGGDDFSGLVAGLLTFIVLPVSLSCTSAGVWLRRRRRVPQGR